MHISDYMLVALNNIANKHDYRVTGINSVDGLSSYYFKKDGIKKHLLLRNVLTLKPLSSYKELCVQFNAHGSYRIIEHKYREDWIPAKLMNELSKFIATSFSILIQHDTVNNYLVGIMEKKADFYYYARRYFNRELQNEENPKYITRDMVKRGFLYGDFYSVFKISDTRNELLKNSYGNVAPCFYIDLNEAKEKKEGEKYCIDCGKPYHITVQEKTGKEFVVCFDCYKVYRN